MTGARTVLIDGFKYATTAPERLRRRNATVEHYTQLAEQAKP